jgi:AcrR family transcriptional regulator
MKKIEITNAALKLFANQGYEGTSMQQIADATGIQKPSLYAHFKNKLEIYSAIVKRQTVEYKEQIFEKIYDRKGEDPETVFKTLFFLTIDYFSDKDLLLFWKQAYLHAAADTSSESCKVTLQMMNEINRCAGKVFSDFSNGQSEELLEKSKDMMQMYTIILHGFLDFMLVYMDTGIDMQKIANDTWNSLSKDLFIR